MSNQSNANEQLIRDLQDQVAHRFQGGLHRPGLGEDLATFLVRVDHPLEAPDLAFDLF